MVYDKQGLNIWFDLFKLGLVYAINNHPFKFSLSTCSRKHSSAKELRIDNTKIWIYQLSWYAKLAAVRKLKADYFEGQL